MLLSNKIRVSAAQFAVTENISDNLDTCLHMIEKAAEFSPDILVLPEFVNHIAWYRDRAHCFEVAVDLSGEFVSRISNMARQIDCVIKFNVTLRRSEGKVTGTNILVDETGKIIGINDKQILMGNENNFLERASEITPIFPTTIGPVGMYACMDGVIPEVARALAVRNPLILLNSLNSFAYDEANLHIPVRAAENKVFVVAANKVGALVPPALLETIAGKLGIAPFYLHGAGESQIVGPDGAALAKAPRKGDAVVYADIDLIQAQEKQRSDGTHIFSARRPEIYQALGAAPSTSEPSVDLPEMVEAAVFQPAMRGPNAVDELLEALLQLASDIKLLVLPELFHLPENISDDLPFAVTASDALETRLMQALQGLPPTFFLAYSIVQVVDGKYHHAGRLLDRTGVRLTQPQLHSCGRHAWVTALGDRIETIDLPLGRFAMVVGGDTIFPESYRIAAIQRATIVASPTHILETWETTLGFPERAAENRINVVSATFPSTAGTSGIYAVTDDFTLWTPWKNRPFDGKINVPEITQADDSPGITQAKIYPAATTNRMISHRTDVVDDRPWALAAPIIQTLSFTQ